MINNLTMLQNCLNWDISYAVNYILLKFHKCFCAFVKKYLSRSFNWGFNYRDFEKISQCVE